MPTGGAQLNYSSLFQAVHTGMNDKSCFCLSFSGAQNFATLLLFRVSAHAHERWIDAWPCHHFVYRLFIHSQRGIRLESTHVLHLRIVLHVVLCPSKSYSSEERWLDLKEKFTGDHGVLLRFSYLA